jgi:hypothetical protein
MAILNEAHLWGATLPSRFKTGYNVLKAQQKLKLYKYLTSNWMSPYHPTKNYTVGESYTAELAEVYGRIEDDADISVATLQWCVNDTYYDLLTSIVIEVEVCGADLVIPYNSDGCFQLRTGAVMHVLRALSREELTDIIYN